MTRRYRTRTCMELIRVRKVATRGPRKSDSSTLREATYVYVVSNNTSKVKIIESGAYNECIIGSSKSIGTGTCNHWTGLLDSNFNVLKRTFLCSPIIFTYL